MKQVIEYSIGPVTIEADHGGVVARKEAGMIRNLYVFPNGMVAAFDKDGQQITTIQGPLWELLETLWDFKDHEPELPKHGENE